MTDGAHSHATDPAIAAETLRAEGVEGGLSARITALENAAAVPPPVTPPIYTPHAPIVVTTNNQVIEGESFTGTGQFGLYAVGSASKHISGLILRQCKFSGFDSAIWAGFVDNPLLEDCVIDGAQYSGIMVLSAVGGSVLRNKVSNIGIPGHAANGGNAYGIAISTQNPATDPQSSGVLVANNTVANVPTWHGLDTHAGINITFSGNTVTGSRHGLFVTGDSAGRRSTGVITDGNSFTAPAGADQYGIVYVYSTGGSVTNNTVTGWPSGHWLLTTSSGDPNATAINLTQSGNMVS